MSIHCIEEGQERMTESELSDFKSSYYEQVVAVVGDHPYFDVFCYYEQETLMYSLYFCCPMLAGDRSRTGFRLRLTSIFSATLILLILILHYSI